MPAPQTPASMEEFQTKAQDFITKAKSEGKSNTAIANTLKFMYGLTQQAIENQRANEISPYQQESLDLERDKLGLSRQIAGFGDDSGDTTLSDIEYGGNYSQTPTTPQASSALIFDEQGNLTEDYEALFNSGTQTTPAYVNEAMKAISEIDKRKTGGNVDLSRSGLSGIDFSGQDKSKTLFNASSLTGGMFNPYNKGR